ncbi:MAG: NADH-quinone oxidoreductase subunit M [Chitinophaga sp.]|jgi:NADH-quinone oxidoreductase subunit M|nr:NADH-quinone oxidoreductase subunit M [Chitinophaga sp.]
MLLSSLVILPLLTVLAVAFCKELQQIRVVAFIGTLLQLALVAYIYTAYQSQSITQSNFLLERDCEWFPLLNIHYHVGVDGISMAMIILTAIIVIAGVLVSWKIKELSKEFFILLLLLSAGAYGFFISLDVFTLFFFLEVAVIPKFLLITIWGSGKKEYSAMKLALMLMTGSALIFVGLMGLYYTAHSFDLQTISKTLLNPEAQKIIFPFLFIGFGFFAALFPFHTWVPDGHSSAPTAASMFLAGISMKLGGYGCLRVATYLLPYAAQYYSPYIIALAAIAILYGAFATMMQTDLKYINAYSSVSHCGFVLLGIGMLTQTAITGAVMQMVSHGLITALFFAAIGMLYERTHTRQVKELGGLLKVMPFISTVFIIAGLCSLGLPGLSGFAAEVTVFVGSWQRTETAYRIATIVSCASIVVTAVYILRATGSSILGAVKNEHFLSLKDATWNEKLAALLLLIGIIVIGIMPYVLQNAITAPVVDIMNHLNANK